MMYKHANNKDVNLRRKDLQSLSESDTFPSTSAVFRKLEDVNHLKLDE